MLFTLFSSKGFQVGEEVATIAKPSKVVHWLYCAILLVLGHTTSHATIIDVPADFATVQAAIDAAAAGDTVRLDNASSPFTEDIITIPLSKTGLTIEGQGSVISSTSINFGLNILANDVILLDLTIDGAGTFGFITGDPANGGNGLTMTNCSAINCGGTGFAMTGVDNLTLNQLTSTNNGGNGMSLTSVQNVTITDYTSSGNTFGMFGAGIGIFSCDTYAPCEASTITITGIVDISESPEIYSQESVCGGTCPVGSVMGITLTPSNVTYDYFLGIGATQRFYYQQLMSAYTAADLTLDANPALRPLVFVEEVVSGNKYLAPRSVANEDLSIQAAVDFASAGDTLFMESGTMIEGSQIIIDKDITIVGSGKLNTVLRPGFNTGTSSDARGWFVVEPNVSFNIEDLTLNGSGYLIWQGIRNKGEGTVDNVLFTEIKYQESGPAYQGTGIAAFGTGNVDVFNSMFTEMGRIGVLYFQTGISNSTFKNNMYTGKGDGDWLDYALDISAGANVTVDSNIIIDNRGVASVDGSNSGGVLVSTFFGPGTVASLVNNDITDCFFGLVVGFNDQDASSVSARGNNFVDNRWGVFTTNPEVDAILNWWGDASGPDDVGPGVGDSVSTNVLFCPWLTAPSDGSPVMLEPIIIICPQDYLIDCGDDVKPDFTGRPTATGPLNIDFSYVDSVVSNPAGPIFHTIFRKWFATNTCGSIDSCTQIIEIEDRFPPTIVDCPADLVVDLTSNQNCDTTVFLQPPTAKENCVYNDFAAGMDEGFWTFSITGPGGGSNGNAVISGTDDTLTMMATDNGIAPLNTNTDYCITIPRNGLLEFEWIAEAIGGGAQLNNDEAAILINGTETIIATGGNSMQAGTGSIPLNLGDQFCFRVKGNNQGARTTLMVTELVYIPEPTLTQISGPILDTAPGSGDGDVLTPGNYEVVWEAEDFAGNTSRCTTKIQIAGVDKISCKDINVSLDENCGVKVVPGMVVSGLYTCLDFFVVEIFDHGVPIGDSIGLEYLDHTLDFTVTDPGSGNSCWGKILVEDKYEPEIVCVNDTMNCIEFTHNIKFPEVIEFCQDFDTIVVDEIVVDLGCNGDFAKRVSRKLIAIDASGNISDTCFQDVFIEKFPIGDVQPPSRFEQLYCGSGFDTTAQGLPSPMATGRPFLVTQGNNGILNIPLWPVPNFEVCNLSVEFRDQAISGTDCTRRFTRTWTIRSLCAFNTPRVFQQTIDIIDNVGPELEIGLDEMNAKAGRRSCDALVDMPVASVRDICNNVDRVDMVYPGGIAQGQNGGNIRLPVGRDTVIYRAYDDCYNISTDTIIVIVEDEVAPVAICDQFMTVTLDNDGIVSVRADAFDDGSFDECALDSFSVQRMTDACGTGTDDWGSVVDFCCADIGADVMVRFRVTDKSGNENTCMVRVEVQDKQAPRIVGLPNIRVDCRFDWDPNNLDIFGKFVFDPADRDSIKIDADFVAFIGDPLDGLVLDNCPPVMEEKVDSSNVTNCGLGYLVRFFTFTDPSGNDATWSQTIFFVNPTPFDSTDIIWPLHVDTMNVCFVDSLLPQFLPEDQGFPRFMNEDECSLVGYDYEDEVIDASLGNEACFKIIRRWTVIDWCTTNINGGVHKKWYYDQVIEVPNTIAPEILSPCTDTVREVISNDCQPDSIVLQAFANDDCTDSLNLFWTYKIDTANDGSFDIVGNGNDASGLYPFGAHKIKWIVEDLCGNLDSCEYLFELRNVKTPTAYCMSGMIAELTPVDTTGDTIPDIEFAEVIASEFDAGSSHICGHPVVLSFSPDITDTVRTYDCDSLIPPRRDVTIWVTDTITGLTSQCKTFVVVQDNNNVNVCGTTATGSVSGLIQIEGKAMINDVMVELTRSGGRMDMSDDNGAYSFDGVTMGGSYEIIPNKDGNDLNGVSTADLVAIQRHLLGKTPIYSPYTLIAADVNNSGSVSAADIAELRKLILGVYGAFPNNSSWRFVDESYNFPNRLNPWEEDFPESYKIEPFEQDMEVDFMGVKVGDVTGDVVVGGAAPGNDIRSVVEVSVPNVHLEEGALISVPLYVEDIESLSGMQFTLEWDNRAIEFEELIPNTGIGMDLHNWGTHLLEEGLITLCWHTTTTYRLPSEKQRKLGTLKFRVLNSQPLADIIHISEAVTRNEVYYKSSFEKYAAVLNIGGEVDNYHFALYQNVPNPWSLTTTIAFNLPTDEEARLSFFDESGRMVKVIESNFERGLNKVEVNKDDFRSGMYYYRLDTKSKTSTKKMIIL